MNGYKHPSPWRRRSCVQAPRSSPPLIGHPLCPVVWPVSGLLSAMPVCARQASRSDGAAVCRLVCAVCAATDPSLARVDCPVFPFDRSPRPAWQTSSKRRRPSAWRPVCDGCDRRTEQRCGVNLDGSWPAAEKVSPRWHGADWIGRARPWAASAMVSANGPALVARLSAFGTVGVCAGECLPASRVCIMGIRCSLVANRGGGGVTYPPHNHSFLTLFLFLGIHSLFLGILSLPRYPLSSSSSSLFLVIFPLFLVILPLFSRHTLFSSPLCIQYIPIHLIGSLPGPLSCSSRSPVLSSFREDDTLREPFLLARAHLSTAYNRRSGDKAPPLALHRLASPPSFDARMQATVLSRPGAIS